MPIPGYKQQRRLVAGWGVEQALGAVCLNVGALLCGRGQTLGWDGRSLHSHHLADCLRAWHPNTLDRLLTLMGSWSTILYVPFLNFFENFHKFSYMGCEASFAQKYGEGSPLSGACLQGTRCGKHTAQVTKPEIHSHPGAKMGGVLAAQTQCPTVPPASFSFSPRHALHPSGP